MASRDRERHWGTMAEARDKQRVKAEVGVRVENAGHGWTRDVSPSGVYFVIDEALEVRQIIRFQIEFDAPGGQALHLNCVGKVVRVEEASGKVGVAVSIIESQLERS